MKFHHLRKDYSKYQLEENTTPADPFILLKQWIANVLQLQIEEPYSMVIATVNVDNQPSMRVVLLREITNEGLVFYTNYSSQKAQELAANPQVSIHFFWKEVEQQIRLQGTIQKVDTTTSDTYFGQRPRESQIGAWASPQSQKIANREMLQNWVVEYTKKFENQSIVPRPDYWGGYIVKPTKIEFWQGRDNRLHDRIVYQKNESQQWNKYRLAP